MSRAGSFNSLSEHKIYSPYNSKKEKIESNWRRFGTYWEWLGAFSKQLRVIVDLSELIGNNLLHLPYN